MASNGDTDRIWKLNGEKKPVVGLGSFHKTLNHNEFGEVKSGDFKSLVDATRGDGDFKSVPMGKKVKNQKKPAAKLVNPRAGLAHDRLVRHPASYTMPPAPKVDSLSTAAEMNELYWMAVLRDVPFGHFDCDAVKAAAEDLDGIFKNVAASDEDPGKLESGVDLPMLAGKGITPQNIFRIGLPDEEFGPLVSQFFLRNAQFGTQTIDQQQRAYKAFKNYLTKFEDWLDAQNTGRGTFDEDYPKSNEKDDGQFDLEPRYISTMRDLARFVHKDALHQAYFNAALILLSGEAKWTKGNPYGDGGLLQPREAGFGTLGGPHILNLVSEVATRALKVVWNQKWQVHLRLRPEAYGGLVHVQEIGIGGKKKTTRDYGLRGWKAAKVRPEIMKLTGGTFLLPMAFSSGSPVHPAYGAGHATVAGACVTVLKAYFQTVGISIDNLKERAIPYGKKGKLAMWTPIESKGCFSLKPIADAGGMTIEGELNKLASNVAMGRSMGGVHWRSDNTRSLILGEALAAQMLAEITVDLSEKPVFEFRTFARDAKGKPRDVRIAEGRIYVDGVQIDPNPSAL